MPQYLSPGVYVEEVPSAARPIAGVGTSTAGFIGVVKRPSTEAGSNAGVSGNNPSPPKASASPKKAGAANVADNTAVEPAAAAADSSGAGAADTSDYVKMPLKPGKTGKKSDGTSIEPNDFYTVAPAGEPLLITSWEEFKNNFGDIQAGNAKLAQAVYGFFNNGGTRCWVIGVAADTDITNPATALGKFKAIDEIAIVAIPGATTKAQQDALLDHCEGTQDRVAVLDGAPNPSALNDLGAIKSTGGTAARNSNYGALYFPWIKVLDPVTGQKVSQPPSGHIAGIYARVDATRGVHKAPANEVIRGALDVERRLSKADQDGLNPSGINAIRAFDGTIKVFGARTLGGDANTEWKYISTRRFFNFLRESIDNGTQWVVFEPNTPALWQSITRNVTAFLTGVWRSGALFGNTAQEAFYVKCDADTNSRAQRDLGMVVTEVGVAIVRPAEFVIFRLSQWAGPGA
jgi:phage tail sheath protein FI